MHCACIAFAENRAGGLPFSCEVLCSVKQSDRVSVCCEAGPDVAQSGVDNVQLKVFWQYAAGQGFRSGH